MLSTELDADLSPMTDMRADSAPDVNSFSTAEPASPVAASMSAAHSHEHTHARLLTVNTTHRVVELQRYTLLIELVVNYFRGAVSAPLGTGVSCPSMTEEGGSGDCTAASLTMGAGMPADVAASGFGDSANAQMHCRHAWRSCSGTAACDDAAMRVLVMPRFN